MDRAGITAAEARDRGLNLLVAVGLIMTAIAFGITGYRESHDSIDMLDDLALVAIGLASLLVFQFRQLRRSRIPLVLTAAAIASQLIGLVLEHDDFAASSDNVDAIAVLVVLLGVTAWQYFHPVRVVSEDNREVARADLDTRERLGTAPE